jgi:hypothetical protein
VPKRTRMPVGALLDALGVRMSLGEGQQLVDAVVVGKLVDFNADPRHATSLVLGASEGMDWIGQCGLLSAANAVITADISRGGDPD